jgi:hypothetical protein
MQVTLGRILFSIATLVLQAGGAAPSHAAGTMAAAGGGECPASSSQGNVDIGCASSRVQKPGSTYDPNIGVWVRNGYYCKQGKGNQINWCRKL